MFAAIGPWTSLRVVAVATFAVLTLACGRPIELVDEGVVVVEGELPFAVEELSSDAREALRVTAELVGHGAEITLVVGEDGRLSGELAFALESEAEVPLVVRAHGGLSLADEPVLLAEHRTSVALVPRGDATVTLAAEDFTTKAPSGVDAFRFDKNRNARSNVEDLLAGCAPGVPSAAVALSATDLQFTSGIAPGTFARQVLVLDNVGERDVEYWVRVVGAPGVAVSSLDVEAEQAPIPRAALGDEGAPLVLPPGEESLVAVTFAPADSTLTTGFLVVESRDACAVRQAGAVRLIGNADGAFAPKPAGFDPADLPDPSALGLDDELPVSTAANQHLFDGEPVTLPALSSAEPSVDVAGTLARSAALVTLPAATRLGVGLVDLPADADLFVFAVEGAELVEPVASIHPGTDAETLVVEPAPEERHFLVVVSEAPVDGAGTAIESFKLFFRASSVPTFGDPAVAPRVGTVDGGTAVTIFGAGFRPGAEVFFAGAPATGVVVDPSGTSLTAVTPAGTLLAAYNPATLVVRNPPQGVGEAQFATLPEAFLYSPSEPVLISLDPASAVVGEDQLVLIRGAGFTEFFGPVEVDFGGVPSTSVSLLSSTEILALAPSPDAPGAVEVTVRLEGPDEPVSASLPAAFTWVAPLAEPPVVESVSPASGAAGTPLVVTVAGSGFANGARVYFAGPTAERPASSVTFVDESELTVVTPALAAGDYAVVVENPDEQRATSQPTFIALEVAAAEPVASAITPDVVHAEVPGDVLSVLGANLAAQVPVAVSIESDEQTFAATLSSLVDALATVRVDAPLPAGSAYRVRVDYGAVVVRSPPFAAEAPALFAAQVIGAPAVEGQPFTLLLTGQRLFPARLTGVRFDGPTTTTLTPSSKTESNVRVDVPALVQGSYAATLVYEGGFEAALASALYVDGECGDGAKSALEECDLEDLGGATCASEGFVGGVLSCNGDCTLNASLCDGCGNGVLEAGEECDGADLGNASCETLGFTGGELSCHAATCSVVQSACTLCGDGVREGGEACDGDDLGGQTCGGLGFTSGTLACRSDCAALDVLGCEECGDGVCSGSETSASCSADCVATCGNDTCDVGESCSSCPLDCSTCGPYHLVVTAGAGQSAAIGQTLASQLSLRVEDDDGSPVPGVLLTFTPPEGGRVVGDSGATSITGVDGSATITVSLGFTVGTQSVVVNGIGPAGAAIEELPLTLDFTADDVPAGSVYTLYNRFGGSGDALDASRSAAFSRASDPKGLAFEPDGSLLVVDRGNRRVLRISPAGAIEHVAGNGTTSDAGELVDARTVGLNRPEDVEPDGSGGFYVVTSGGFTSGRVRHVDAAGIIRTYAGAASNNFPQRGDGGPAKDAYFEEPVALARHPSGDLIVVDNTGGGQHIRRIAQDTTTVSTVVRNGVTCELDGATMNLNAMNDAVFEGSTIYFTTARIPSTGTNACAPQASDLGGQREGGTPLGVAFSGGGAEGIALDVAGNLYTWSATTRQLVRVDPLGRVTAVAGNGSSGYSGDYGPALEASFGTPRALAMSPSGDLYVADGTQHNVRVIRGVGATTAPVVTLSLVSTPPFSAATLRPALPVTVRAAVDGVPAVAVPVSFTVTHGHKVEPPSALSDGFGDASTVPWTGLYQDTYTFRAVVKDRMRSPVSSTEMDIDVEGVAHPAGTVLTVLNLGGAASNAFTGSAVDTRLSNPESLATLPGGGVVVADTSNHRVVRLNPDGTTEVIAGNGAGNAFAVSGLDAATQPFPAPRAVATTAAGEVYVAVAVGSPTQGRIYKVDLAGKAIHVAGGGANTPDGVVATTASLGLIYDLDYADDTGTLYTVDNATIRRVDASGFIWFVPDGITCGSGVGSLTDIAYLGDGHVAVVAELNGCPVFSQFHFLADVDTATGETVELSDGFSLVRTSGEADGFAVSPLTGLLYFETRYQIYRREDDGTFTHITGVDDQYGFSDPPSAAPGALLDNPCAFAFDELGDLYFLEQSRNTVRVLTNPDAL